MVRRGTGALDDAVGPGDLLNPDVTYDRPPGGGDAIFDLVGDLAGKRVLDIGCGHAPYRDRLEKKGAVWTGLDLTGPACSVIGDGDQLPFRDEAFDAVFCAAVLEHIPEPDSIMSEMKRVLNNKGRIFGYVSFLEPMHGMSYFHMSHLGIERLFFKHGFRPLTIFPARIGTAYQIECLLFPKSLPVLQPVVSALLQWSFAAAYWLNGAARSLYRSLSRRSPRADPADSGRDYRRLLALRFAVGFNFVAVRDDTARASRAGYRKLVK
ncbi:MAG: class I SAM-dependent methyltransferase [Candidatus Latescibacterota bacterium]|nr:MAG: class I SAM-dependent methyltransferase [Candidatus Latescibacterota bacterium]